MFVLTLTTPTLLDQKTTMIRRLAASTSSDDDGSDGINNDGNHTDNDTTDNEMNGQDNHDIIHPMTTTSTSKGGQKGTASVVSAGCNSINGEVRKRKGRAVGKRNDRSGDRTTHEEPMKYTMKFPGMYISELNDNDVLQGRGTGSNQNLGNLRYRALVEVLAKTYISTPGRKEKNRMVKELIRSIHVANGRFLHPLERSEAEALGLSADVGWYVEISDEDASWKAKEAIRYTYYKRQLPVPKRMLPASTSVGGSPNNHTSTHAEQRGGGEDRMKSKSESDQTIGASGNVQVNFPSIPGEWLNQGVPQDFERCQLPRFLSTNDCDSTNDWHLRNHLIAQHGLGFASKTPTDVEQGQQSQMQENSMLLHMSRPSHNPYSSTNVLAHILAESVEPSYQPSLSSLALHSSLFLSSILQEQQLQQRHHQLLNHTDLAPLLHQTNHQHLSQQELRYRRSTTERLRLLSGELSREQQIEELLRQKSNGGAGLQLQRPLENHHNQQPFVRQYLERVVGCQRSLVSHQQLPQVSRLDGLLQHLQQTGPMSQSVGRHRTYVDNIEGYVPCHSQWPSHISDAPTIEGIPSGLISPATRSEYMVAQTVGSIPRNQTVEPGNNASGYFQRSTLDDRHSSPDAGRKS
jgi:hypothetical protein